MLITISNAQKEESIINLLENIKENDGVLFWQDGVFAIEYYLSYLNNHKNLWVLKADCDARNLTTSIPTINFSELVEITAQFYPQLAK